MVLASADSQSQGDVLTIAAAGQSGSRQCEVFHGPTHPMHESPACASAGLKGFLAERWSVADLSSAAMLVVTAATADRIGHAP
jgi:hypothetical protein